MPLNIRQIDNADQLPPYNGGDPAPYEQPRPRARHDWPTEAARWIGGLLTLLIVYWLVGRDVRYWLTTPEGSAVKLIAGAVALAFALRRLILVRQPGGYQVALWETTRMSAERVVMSRLEVERTHAGTAGRLIAQQTYSPQYQNDAPQLQAPAIDAEIVDVDPFELALANVPRLIDLEHIIDQAPGAMSVPLGTDHMGASRWLDLRKGILHVGIFGGSGAGKDNLLESWFLALTKNNAPDRVQFAVLDGKGHWMKPIMNNLAHMWMPPAGGIGDEGQRALEHTLKAIQTEAARRGKLVFGANCDTMEMYCQKTGETMPYLVVMISDVMGNVVTDVDRLLVDLVSKARALGIRVFVSMQTPTRQNTQWRTNLSTVLAAQMQQSSNDAPALGLVASDMQFPPSRLPDPQSRPGLFSVRNGRDQFLIQAPLVRKPFLSQIVADLPTRHVSMPQPPARPVVSASVRPSDVARAAITPADLLSMPVPDGRTPDGQRTKLYLKAMASAGKTRDYARSRMTALGMPFENSLWTDVRRELGLRD